MCTHARFVSLDWFTHHLSISGSGITVTELGASLELVSPSCGGVLLKNIVKFVNVVARFEMLCSCISLLGFDWEGFSRTRMDFFTLTVACLLGHEVVEPFVLDLFSWSSPVSHMCTHASLHWQMSLDIRIRILSGELVSPHSGL